LINHGIPEELLERVKKVSTEFYKLEREENFKNSTTVKLLNDIAEKRSSEKLENVDWEDVITLLDDNEWPENTPSFRYKANQLFFPSKI
jgi:aminocyclopropanecarboxylate oxidase